MNIKSITIFSVFLLLFSFAMTAAACPPPDCGDCETWNGEECVPYGDCWGGCPSCESCVGCYCQCTSECGCDGKTCSGCKSCVDCACEDDQSKCTAECDKCLNGSCVDDQSQCFFCDSCVSGSCISTCTACQKCVDDGGYICVNDCPDCKDCVGSSCEGGCDECYECVEWAPGSYECDHLCLNGCPSPKYCDGCRCVECSLGTPDTSTCSSSNDTTCQACDTGIGDACADHTIKLYENTTLYPCTGADCDDIEEICYKEYDCDDGTILAFHLCYSSGTGLTCNLNTDFPSWCTTCVQDTADTGTEFPEGSYSCPEEGSSP